MSKEVDERVVSMQFNNKNFETNAQTTLGTLDKLKQKLNLSGASKGLENVGAAAKKVDMSGISSGIETVRTRFSALEVMGVTALANITNSAVNAGKRIVSALTIDPVKTGLSEYELKLNSVQTIMASTGEDIKTVNKYLEDLNTYSDQTIYSFSDMTQNIGKFTNAGVKLEDAVTAIKGISNAAALSGANTQEASRSMYNFAQALSAGYVKLIDWKSIELANMATKGFKEELIKTAVEVGTLTKKGDQYVSTTTDMNGKVSEAFTSTKFFNESLSAQWMTTDVLIKTLARYTDETTQLGKDATQAATQVKSLSQMFDVLKETAQSGWAKTWEIIFGDLEQAKAIFTPLTSFFGKIIDKMSDFRNKILEGALGNPFELLLKKLDASPLGKITKTITDATGKLEYYQDIVSKVWNGDYKNAPVRYQLLDDAGYDHRIVQSLVNKGYEYKLTVKDIEDAYKKYGKTVETVTEPTKDLAKTLEELSDEELKNLGYTDEEIRMLRALAQEAKKTGKPISELIAEMSKADGRTLLVESFKNIGKAIGDLGKTIKKAWQEIFPPKTAEERSIQLYNLIKALNSFTKKLRMSTDTADKFRRTFKGVFALLDIILTVIGGPIKLVFKILKQLLGVANIDLLSLTAIIGDGIVKFRDWIDRVLDFTDVFKKLLPTLKKAGKAFGDWIDKLKQSDNIPRDIILGLVNGLKAGITIVGKTMWELGKSMINKLRDVIDSHSPARKFIEIGIDAILGLVIGIKESLKLVWDLITASGKKLIELVKDLSLDKVLLGFIAGGIILAFVKIASAIKSIAGPFEDFGDMMEGIGSAARGLGMKLKGDAIKSIAIAIAILTASVIALTFVDTGKLVKSIIALGALAGILAILTFAASKMDGGLKDMGKTILSIVGIAAAMLLAAMALKKIASIEDDQMLNAIIGLTAVTTAMVTLVAIFGKFAQNRSMVKAGKMLQQMAVALLIMAIVIRLMGTMEEDMLYRGMKAIALIGGVFAAMVAVSKFAGQHASSAGSMLLKMSLAFVIMTVVIKKLAGIKDGDIAKGMGVIIAIGGVFTAAVALSKFAGEHASKAGSMLLKMSIAFLIMSLTMKILATMDVAAIYKGIAALTAMGVLCGALIFISKFSGENAAKAGLMLLSVSAALMIMTGVVFLLSLFDPSDLARGVAALAIMEGCIAGLIAVTKLARSTKGMRNVLLTLIGTIVLFVAAVIALTFIDPADLTRSTASIAILLGVFTAMIAITKIAQTGKGIIGTLVTLMAVVVLLTGVLIALSLLDVKNTKDNVSALSALLIATSAAMLLISKMGNVKISDMMKGVLGIAAIGLVVAELGIILGLLEKFKMGTSITMVLSISNLIVVLASILPIVASVGKMGVKALLGVAALALVGLVVGEIGVILGLLNKYDLRASMSAVIAISTILIVMAAILPIVGAVGLMGPMALLGVAALALVGLVVGEIGLILGLLSKYNLGAALPAVITISTLLIVMTAILPILAVVGAVAVPALIGVAVLAAVIAALGALFVGIGYLADSSPKLETFLNKAIPILGKIGEGIGAFIGGIVGGFLGEASYSLVILGENLSLFMEKSSGFIEGAKKVDSSVIAGVGILSAAILAITAVDLINGVASFLQGGSSLITLGNELTGFILAALPFLTIASTINKSSMEGIKTLAEAVMIFTASSLIDGISRLLGGESTFEKFGKELPKLGTGLIKLLEVVGDYGKGDADTIGYVADSLKYLARASQEIPNTGGLLGKLVGDNDLGVFAEQFPSLGTGLTGLLNNLPDKNFTEEQYNIVKRAADAMKYLAQASQEIPNTGGLLGKLVGDNDLKPFAEQFPSLGTGLTGLLNNLPDKNFTEAQYEIVKRAADAMKHLAKASQEIPNTGGLLGDLVGNNDLKTFAEQFPSLGTGLRNLIKNIGESFTDGDKNIVKRAAECVKELAKAADEIPNTGGWVGKIVGENDLGDFAAQFPKIGTGLSGIVSNMKGFVEGDIALVNLATSAVSTLASAAASIEDSDANASFWEVWSDGTIADFAEQFPSLGTGLSKFINNLGGAEKADAAAKAMNSVASLVAWLPNIPDDKSIPTKFPKLIEDLGSAVFTFASYYLESVKTNIDGMRDLISKIISSMNTLSEVNTKSIDDVIQSIEWLAGSIGFISDAIAQAEIGPTLKEVLTELISVDMAKIKTVYEDIGFDLMYWISTGIFDNEFYVTDAIDSVVKNVMTPLNDLEDSCYTAGEYVVEGVASGVDDYAYLAVDRADHLGNAIKTAIYEALEVASPSKATYRAGRFAVLGLVNSLRDGSSSASDAGEYLANSSMNGLRDAMSNMFDVVNNNLDVQPTITPVLDLSEVQSGANHISSLFKGNRVLSIDGGVVGNVSSRVSEIQNGRNNDLITAIDKLRKDVNDMPRNNYSINGVSYTENSDVEEAFQTIIRAARVERRK